MRTLITNPPATIPGRPMFFHFELGVGPDGSAPDERKIGSPPMQRPGLLGALLPDGRSNIAVSGNSDGVNVVSFRILGVEQLTSPYGLLPLAAFVRFMQEGAFVLPPVAVFAEVSLDLRNVSNEARPLIVCMVPMVLE